MLSLLKMYVHRQQLWPIAAVSMGVTQLPQCVYKLLLFSVEHPIHIVRISSVDLSVLMTEYIYNIILLTQT